MVKNPKAQQIIDSNIVKNIIEIPSELKLSYFWEINDQLSDSVYWLILATIWMDAEVCAPNYDYWKTLFQSKRPGRQKLMKKGDRKKWNRLPNIVTAYRSVNNPEENKTAISWTLDKTIAEKLSNGREVISKKIQKSLIIAYFDRRKEKEIIVLFN